jgi:hypothetical protein
VGKGQGKSTNNFKAVINICKLYHRMRMKARKVLLRVRQYSRSINLELVRRRCPLQTRCTSPKAPASAASEHKEPSDNYAALNCLRNKAASKIRAVSLIFQSLRRPLPDVLRALAGLESTVRLFLYVAKTGNVIFHKIPSTQTLFFV